MNRAARLDAVRIATIVDELASFAAADPVELIEAIGQLERLKNAAAAAQARAAVDLRQIREAEARSTGHTIRRITASVAGEIGLARHESPHRATILLSLASTLNELPHTRTAFNTGEISEWRVTVIARETACLSKTDRAIVDAELAPHLTTMSTRQLYTETKKIAYRLDPHSIVNRIGKAIKDRHVSCRPAPDCMTYVSALLPAAQGVAAYAALVKAAGGARATGDQRSKGQVMADTLVARITGQQSADEVGVEVQIVITDEALLGTSETPARLNGYGPIPARIARGLATGAIAGNQAWIRRLYSAPGDGRLVAMESTRRRFPKGMKAFIEARDEVCRTPWCDAPIRHTDHIIPVHGGGATTISNGQGLCEQCNQLKEHPGWRHTTGTDGTITVRTPTGHRHHSRPPELPHEPPFIPFTVDFRYFRSAA